MASRVVVRGMTVPASILAMLGWGMPTACARSCCVMPARLRAHRTPLLDGIRVHAANISLTIYLGQQRRLHPALATLDLDGRHRGHWRLRPKGSGRLRTDDDLAQLGRGLEPLGNVRRVADHGEVPELLGADVADQRRPGVDADPEARGVGRIARPPPRRPRPSVARRGRREPHGRRARSVPRRPP